MQARIKERVTRTILKTHDPNPMVAALATAYLDLCRRRAEFMRAALACEDYASYMFIPDPQHPKDPNYGTLKPNALETLIVDPPARWEFIHTWVFGSLPDAICCANRYDACAQFIGISPVEPYDPWFPLNVTMRHKDTSPWFQRLKRRRELKAQLGSQYRALVSHARKWTKKRFLEEYRNAEHGEQRQYEDGTWHHQAKLVPHITDAELLHRTGYTPEEFWREVHKPNTVKPRFLL